MMLLEVQTALCILSLPDKRRGVMRVNKIFYVVLAGCDSCKSKLHNTEIPQTAYLLEVQAKFPNNVFLNSGNTTSVLQRYTYYSQTHKTVNT